MSILPSNSDQEAFYKKLKAQLLDTSQWPSVYLYKFIVLSDTEKIQKIAAIFSQTNAQFLKKESKNGKYTSVSVKVEMENPDCVISKYKEVANTVEGVIPL